MATTDRFAAAYAVADVGRRHDEEVEQHLRPDRVKPNARPTTYLSSFGQQYLSLLYRSGLIATRDPTLFFFQLLVHLQFGFLVGATFWMSDFSVGAAIEKPFGAVAWLCIISAFIQIFKAHYLVISNARFRHEHANHMYAILPFWLAETTTNVVCSVIFLPGVAIGYFMSGLPSSGVGVTLLVTYTLGLAMEAALHVITLFASDAAYSVVISLILTMFFSAYTAGLFIRPNIVPSGWGWFQDLSIFYSSSRSIAWHVMGLADFQCADDGSSTYVPSSGSCVYTGLALPCDAGVRNGTCFVKGTTIMTDYKGFNVDDGTWGALGELVGLGLGFRLLVLVFYFGSPKRLLSSIKLFCCARQSKGRRPTEAHGAEEHEPAAASEVTMLPEHDTVLPIHYPAAVPRLEWQNLRVVVEKWRSSKELITGLSGSAVGGRLLSLMGPSGAGKTTMLNALCGRASYAKVAGGVLLNGRPLLRNDLNYVPQFDEFSPSLTVRENFVYAARLHQPRDEADPEWDSRVENLLEAMGLTHCVGQLPQSMTSGERKRISVGLGLAARPRVIFLDEPTTVSVSTCAGHHHNCEVEGKEISRWGDELRVNNRLSHPLFFSPEDR
jgi:ABC-type lipoprotein export system ATPase subunit